MKGYEGHGDANWREQVEEGVEAIKAIQVLSLLRRCIVNILDTNLTLK